MNFFVVLTLFLFLSCTRGPEPGIGEGLSTLDDLVSGTVFGSAFTVATPLTILDAVAITSSEQNCSESGTQSVTPSLNSTKLINSISYKDCRIVINLAGTDYTETVSGSGKYSFEEAEQVTTYELSLSLSGDLGLAVDCQVTVVVTNNTPDYSGDCRVFDDVGDELEIPLAVGYTMI